MVHVPKGSVVAFVDDPDKQVVSKVADRNVQVVRMLDKRIIFSLAANRVRGDGDCQQGSFVLTMLSPIRNPTIRVTDGRSIGVLSRAETL